MPLEEPRPALLVSGLALFSKHELTDPRKCLVIRGIKAPRAAVS